jgi:hypothetical protein
MKKKSSRKYKARKINKRELKEWTINLKRQESSRQID